MFFSKMCYNISNVVILFISDVVTLDKGGQVEIIITYWVIDLLENVGCILAQNLSTFLRGERPGNDVMIF
jgi:hypothetical protein